MRVALITGGNRGIGFAASEGLARQGIKVLLGCRNSNDGKAAARLLQSQSLDVEAVVIDVSEKSSIEKAAKEIHENYGALDILVNNAGVLPHGSLLEVSEEGIQEGLQVNLLGPIYCIRAFLPKMIEKGYGRIVNVSSGWGAFHEGLEGPAIYSITKAALNAVTMNGARDLPPSIKMNAMCPGWVRTRMGGMQATRSVEQGADTILWLSTLDDAGPSGKFFRDRKEIAW